jgi:hypothetical protein
MHLLIFAGEVLMYNVFYEIFTFCTSVIAEDTNGNFAFYKSAYLSQNLIIKLVSLFYPLFG